MSYSLQPQKSQHARHPCPSPTPEFTETHVHRVSDAIQPSHPLSSPSPLAPIPASIRVFSNESTLRMKCQNTGVILIQTVQDLHDINTAWILQDVGVFLFVCFVLEKARVSTVESVMSSLRAKILARVFHWPLCLSHNTCPLLPSSSAHRPKNSTFLSLLPAINI